MQINTTSDALDNLNKKLGGADIEIEPSTNKVDALKKIYKTLGGTDDVKGLSTVYQVLEKITEVAEGGGGGSLPSVTSADAGKLLAVNDSGEWAAEQKIFYLIYNEDENTFNLTPEQAFELLRTGVQIVSCEGYIDPEDTTTVDAGRKEYIKLFYDAGVYKLLTEAENIVAGTFTSPFYID